MNTYSSSQVSRTGNPDNNLILRQYRLDQMCKFMKIKSDNPKMTQKEICQEICLSGRTVSRFRKDTNMISPYKSTSPRHKNDKIRQNPPQSAKIRHINAQNNNENHQNTPENSQKQRKNRRKSKKRVVLLKIGVLVVRNLSNKLFKLL